eukprot:671719-Alexandrium_andersonii.AAC.1
MDPCALHHRVSRAAALPPWEADRPLLNKGDHRSSGFQGRPRPKAHFVSMGASRCPRDQLDGVEITASGCARLGPSGAAPEINSTGSRSGPR